MRNIDRIRIHANKETAILIKSKPMKKYIETISGGAIDVLITSEKDYLILDGRYILEAENYKKDYTVIENTPAQTGKPNFDVIENICIEKGILNLKIESEAYTPVEYLKMCGGRLNILPFDDEIRKIKMIKSEEEIKIMKEACEITDKVFNNVLKHIKLGMTENELSGWVHYYSMKYGAEGMSFSPVISSGERTAYPHARPTERKICRNEPVMIDFGIIYKGYQTDITRTVFTGKPSEIMMEIYNIVKMAQQAGLNAIKAGNLAKDADTAARNIIEKYGYGKYFDHGLGHGIGTDNSTELPKLNQKSKEILEKGMIMSCEPGIYIPGMGGVRIEDTVCIIKDKGISLNNITKDMIILEV